MEISTVEAMLEVRLLIIPLVPAMWMILTEERLVDNCLNF